MAELDAIGRAEVSRIKAFLTRTTDRYRPPYERYVVTCRASASSPAASIPDTYLRDETGNRRFWPVRCGDDRPRRAAPRPRPAVGRGRRALPRRRASGGSRIRTLIAAASAEQEARYQSDAWDALIERWLVFERRRVNVGFGGYDDWQERRAAREAAHRRLGRRDAGAGARHRAGEMDEGRPDARRAPTSRRRSGSGTRPTGSVRDGVDAGVAISAALPRWKTAPDVPSASPASLCPTVPLWRFPPAKVGHEEA